MENLPDMKIMAKLFSGSELIGYIVMDTSGKPKKLRVNTVLDLAEQNRFINAVALKRQGTRYLRGYKEQLSDLPSYEMATGETEGKQKETVGKQKETAGKRRTSNGKQRTSNGKQGDKKVVQGDKEGKQSSSKGKAKVKVGGKA